MRSTIRLPLGSSQERLPGRCAFRTTLWTRLVAGLVTLVFLQTSCATYVAVTMPGPKNDDDVHVGMKRSEVELTLRAGPSSQFDERAMTVARYEYSDGPPQWSKLRALLYVGADLVTLFLSELIFWPIELYAKAQIKRVAVAHYDHDWVLKQWSIRREDGEVLHAEYAPELEREVAEAPPPPPVDPASEGAFFPTPPVSAAPPPPAPAPDEVWSGDYGRYHALVIGNNRYQQLPQLRTATADAAAMAEVLGTYYDFEVELIQNATRADIVSALSRYRRNLTPSDNLLIYYAGHGWLDPDTRRGYWLPVDAHQQDSTNWVSSSTIADHLKANPARHILIIADTCYSGVLTRGIAPVLRGSGFYERLARMRSRTALTSGGLEPVEDGLGQHSVFAKAVLKALKENPTVLDGHSLFLHVRRPVILGAEQTPDYGDIRLTGHEGGDFLFVRADTAKR